MCSQTVNIGQAGYWLAAEEIKCERDSPTWERNI